MTDQYCKWCDPELFVIYGCCHNCKRQCNPPLVFDRKTNICEDSSFKFSHIKQVQDEYEKHEREVGSMIVKQETVTVFDVELSQQDLAKMDAVNSLNAHLKLFKEDFDDEFLVEIRVTLKKDAK